MNILSATLDLEDDAEAPSWVSQGSEPNMVFTEDPVALACASYRAFLETSIRWTDLTDVTVTDQDREQAGQIRKYYSDRILLAAVAAKGEMSEFRRKLYGLLIGQTGLKKRDIGLLYRLPYFYAEDTAMDHVMEQTETVSDLIRPQEVAGNFQVIRRIQVSRRSGESVQLWLKKDSSKVPYMIASKLDNPFLTLVESVLKQPTALQAFAHLKHHRGHYRNRLYYQLSNLELVGAS
jgi:hypothetical protein